MTAVGYFTFETCFEAKNRCFLCVLAAGAGSRGARPCHKGCRPGFGTPVWRATPEDDSESRRAFGTRTAEELLLFLWPGHRHSRSRPGHGWRRPERLPGKDGPAP